jgi:hypothetical protein
MSKEYWDRVRNYNHLRGVEVTDPSNVEELRKGFSRYDYQTRAAMLQNMQQELDREVGRGELRDHVKLNRLYNDCLKRHQLLTKFGS